LGKLLGLDKFAKTTGMLADELNELRRREENEEKEEGQLMRK